MQSLVELHTVQPDFISTVSAENRMRVVLLKKLISRPSLRQLVVTSSVVLIILALPWINGMRAILPESILGLDGAFLVSLMFVPCLIGLVLYIASKIADDRERHMRKFENE